MPSNSQLPFRRCADARQLRRVTGLRAALACSSASRSCCRVSRAGCGQYAGRNVSDCAAPESATACPAAPDASGSSRTACASSGRQYPAACTGLTSTRFVRQPAARYSSCTHRRSTACAVAGCTPRWRCRRRNRLQQQRQAVRARHHLVDKQQVERAAAHRPAADRGHAQNSQPAVHAKAGQLLLHDEQVGRDDRRPPPRAAAESAARAVGVIRRCQARDHRGSSGRRDR